MRLKAFMAVAVMLPLSLAGQAAAQERLNPFAPPTAAEEEQARQDERFRRLFREMSAEIEARVMQSVSSAQAAAEVRLRRQIEEIRQSQGDPIPGVVTVQTASRGQQGKGQPGGSADPLEGAKFISCVNGKALYRDKDNALFQVSGNGLPGSDRCAR
jgi:hypothetical protein